MSVLEELEKLGTFKGVSGFILKLYSILQQKQLEKIICWSEDGSEVQIKNCSKLQKKVLPAYFRHDKLESFFRQLNIYGFSKRNRLTHKNNVFFKNECFKRGDLKLLESIKRKKKPELSNQETEATSSENKTFDEGNINWMSLADQIHKLRRAHPELEQEMGRIVELTSKLTGDREKDLSLPVSIDLVAKTDNQLNFFVSLKNIGSEFGEIDSICSFGLPTEDDF